MSDLRSTIFRAWLNAASSRCLTTALDFILLAAAVVLGYTLRLSLIVPQMFRPGLARAAAAYPICILIALAVGGVGRVHWPQAGISEYARLVRAYAAGAAIFFAAHIFVPVLAMPRSSLAVAILAGLIFLGSMRASWRLLELAASRHQSPSVDLKPTLIIGAGEAGAFIARDLKLRQSGLEPRGFIDDDPAKRGKIIAGLSVLGSDDDIPDIARRLGIKTALIAIPSASGSSVRKYLDTLAGLGVEVRVLPSLRELAGGRVELSSMRGVQLQDLLRRDAIRLDEHGIGAVIRGKRVLVTGAGGSIGTELCVQIARNEPDELLMLGHGEGSIYNAVQHIGELGIDVKHTQIIADIADSATMRRIFAEHRPHAVFHAAAHKHVPLMEDNPREALRVNALGTWTVSSLAGEFGAERFIMISTDKAVHPSSVMGATKRIAERLLRTVQAEHRRTAYMTVRFGNVLGSRGSVVPLFERQIARGGPVTVTHTDMTRYFMLIPEAVSLVLQAASMGSGSELFVLDMGEPVRITEMAETLIRLHGLEPHKDIEITYTGIRPGEKLFEELFYDPAHVDRTAHEKIFLSKLRVDAPPIGDEVRELLAEDSSNDFIRQRIFELASR